MVADKSAPYGGKQTVFPAEILPPVARGKKISTYDNYTNFSIFFAVIMLVTYIKSVRMH